jgi:UDP-N-acetyl-2-amino-2-deoxyglucuronate dehydrogenase
MQKYKVAVLGCGAIFSRHLLAIQGNPEHFELIGLYDPNVEVLTKYSSELKVKAYLSEAEVFNDKAVNCVVILSPSYLHYTQALMAIHARLHVIVEKPATMSVFELDHLVNEAKEFGVDIFTILQVRLNPAVKIVKLAQEDGLLGQIRGVSLIQRWQRPVDYFTGWRGTMATGGGILREFAIHYLDVLQHLVGVPKISHVNYFNTKFLATDVADTVYALLDFNSFGGSVEVTISAEPRNLECSLTLMGENGFVRLGGKSLDEIVSAEFLSPQLTERFNELVTQVHSQKVAVLASSGASPYHPELYRQIVINPQLFSLQQTRNVIAMVEEMYAKFSNG